MEELKIVYLPPGELTPYEHNARKHAEEDLATIRASVEQFGFLDPIGIWGEKNIIVEGHGRQLVAIEKGMDKVPCIRLDELTDEQRRAYALAHNKTAEMSGWDFTELEAELAELELDFDMSDFGFDMPGESEEPETAAEDDFDPDAQVEEKAKLGDIYQLGRHRLMCGDSTEIGDVDCLMDGAKADLVFTDPPYNIASDSKNYAADVSKAMENLSAAEWDKNFDITGALTCLFAVLAENVSVYICTSHFLAHAIWDWMKAWAGHYSYCVWAKPNPMPSLSKRHWTWNTELICYATRGKHTFHFPSEGHALSTWTINKKSGETEHPTEKPVAVPAMAITHSSNDGDIVLDLFGGSGSTMIACEQLNRVCYMMELDPHYVDVIIARWEKFTGQKAVLLNG